MKKNRILRLVSLLLCFAFLLSGCGSKSTITTNKITYKYDQELNIVDDNYRNYYEIFVRSFYDSDGDGLGDLKGVTEKLDYIEDMGFNGIWLMPIMESTTYHKYDVVDYESIDSDYGTMEDFEELVNECHKRGIHIIIDFVMNHTSSQNQWFQDACAYLKTLDEDQEIDLNECPYAGYYHFSREKESSTYYQVSGTNWYYEGSFWSEMPDLDYTSEALRSDFEDIIKFWVDKGVDGFRMDATMHFEENQTSFNTEVMNWVYTYACSLNPDFYMVSEVWSDEATLAAYYKSETPSLFNFAASEAEGIIEKTAIGKKSASAFVEKLIDFQETYGASYADYIDAPFLTNHDNIRVANNLNDDEDNMKMAAGLLLTMNGSPFVYYGEEIGMCSTGSKDEDKRLAMDWYADSDSDKTGLTDNPDGADQGSSNDFASVEEQLTDGHSLLNYYKRALRLRNENPEIARGTIAEVSDLSSDQVAAITKTYEDSTIGIIYNTSDEEATLDISQVAELKDMGIRGYLTLNGEEVTLEDGIVTMPAKSILILK